MDILTIFTSDTVPSTSSQVRLRRTASGGLPRPTSRARRSTPETEGNHDDRIFRTRSTSRSRRTLSKSTVRVQRPTPETKPVLDGSLSSTILPRVLLSLCIVISLFGASYLWTVRSRMVPEDHFGCTPGYAQITQNLNLPNLCLPHSGQKADNATTNFEGLLLNNTALDHWREFQSPARPVRKDSFPRTDGMLAADAKGLHRIVARHPEEDFFEADAMYEWATRHLPLSRETLNKILALGRNHGSFLKWKVPRTLESLSRGVQKVQRSYAQDETIYMKSDFWNSFPIGPFGTSGNTPVAALLNELMEYATEQKEALQALVEEATELERYIQSTVAMREHLHQALRKSWIGWTSQCLRKPITKSYNTQPLISDKSLGRKMTGICRAHFLEESRQAMLNDDAKAYYSNAENFARHVRVASQELLDNFGVLTERVEAAGKGNRPVLFSEFVDLTSDVSARVSKMVQETPLP